MNNKNLIFMLYGFGVLTAISASLVMATEIYIIGVFIAFAGSCLRSLQIYELKEERQT